MSQRKNDQKTLEELREMNRRLYNRMKAFQIAAEEEGRLVFTYDTAKQTIYVDERTARAFGVSTRQSGVPYDMVRRGIVSLDTREEYLRIHEAMIQGAEEAGGIVKLVQADGSKSIQELKFRAILDEEGERTGMAVGIYRDITERYLKEAIEQGTDMALLEEIQAQEEAYRKLQRVLQTIKDDFVGIFEVDLEKDVYTILHYNGQGVVPLPERGRYSREIPGALRRLMEPEFWEKISYISSPAGLQKVLDQDRKVEFEYRTALEGRQWMRTTFQVSQMKGGIPSTAVMFLSDIDRMKVEKLKQQQAIEEAYRYAESANMAKTDFLSRMSHDIRTPMNAIIGMTAIASANLEDPKRMKDLLGKINGASKHLLNLINEVLDMSKIESGAIELAEERFNLSDLIDNMITMVMPQIEEHRHNLQVSLGTLRHEKVIGDSLRIQQCFVNLISNAAKYTPDGGRIQLSIQERPAGSKSYGEYVFCFEDNGLGMSREFQEVLFEPFTRAEDSRLSKVSGTGLGMTITRNLIRMMGGDIQVWSELGKGTKFTVTIHLKIQEEQESLPKELQDLSVLVVDDQEDAGRSACLLLKEIGMKGEWCSSGQEAVERIKERAEEEGYFAVILDWKMPRMDGLDTAKAIVEAAGRKRPVLFLAAYDWSAIEPEARAAGVDRFLNKPLFKSRLLGGFRELALAEEKDREAVPLFREEISFKGKRILLAEDNELNAEIAMELLKMVGISVEWVRDGREAVQKVEQSPEGYYHLIFMDIQMPEMDGYQAAAAIRSLDREDVKHLPVVAMTANAFVEDVHHALSAGMNEHIAKPVDMQKLEQVLLQYLA